MVTQIRALVILLGLPYDGVPPTMQKRRIAAARLLGLKPATFRQGKHEPALLMNFAVEIFKAALREETPGEEAADNNTRANPHAATRHHGSARSAGPRPARAYGTA
jgi:hypothetical protein